MATVMLSIMMRSHARAVPRWVARLCAVVAAASAALAIWGIAELAVGIDLRAPSFNAAAETLPVRAQDVLLATGLLSLIGWGFIVVLERSTARAPRAWLLVAVPALVLSLATPLAGTGVSLANRIVLLMMHVAVGSILIPALYRSSPRRNGHG